MITFNENIVFCNNLLASKPFNCEKSRYLTMVVYQGWAFGCNFRSENKMIQHFRNTLLSHNDDLSTIIKPIITL